MKSLFYPAVFHPEDIGYSVSVPDIDGCFTQGDTLDEAYSYTIDAIGLCLEDCFANNSEPPKSTNPKDIICEKDDFVVLIEFNMLEYMKKHDSKAVKKTLTIPSYLNTCAENANINFSALLQDALKERLGLN